MSDPNTIRVLEIDGGGARGLLSLTFLEEFVQLWGTNPATLFEEFDVICGTSIGGILALALALGFAPSALNAIFTQDAQNVFTLGTTGIPPPTSLPIVPSIRPNSVEKLGHIVLNIPFYQSSGTLVNDYGAGSYGNGSGLFGSILTSLFEEATMQDLKTNVVIPTFEYSTKTFVLCSNLNYPEFNGQLDLVSNIALCTAAAPVYLPPILMTGTSPGLLSGQFLDGGIYANNPSQFGISLGKMVKPNASRICLLSLGSGSGNYGFDNDPTTVMRDLAQYPKGITLRTVMRNKGYRLDNLTPLQTAIMDMKLVGDDPIPTFSTIALIFELFSIAQAGGQASVAQSLLLESKYTLDQLYYYRFQPPLDLSLDPSLDNTSPTILAYYQSLAETTFNNDIENIATFLGHLTA